MLRRPSLAVAALVAVAAAVVPATAATAWDGTSNATGHDVSYPQCGRALPERGDIAVVGVNAGTPTGTNPCLAEQLAWGDGAAPDGSRRLADVYVNTADPGHLADWWPAADLTRDGLPLPNPYGTCRGAEDSACGYVYGWSVAADDALRRGVDRPGSRVWWLDVETVNTWSWDREANRAVLEGMTDAFHRLGASVGIYSTTRQWALVVGTPPVSSPLAGLPGWIAGAVTRSGAAGLCATRALTPGGSIRMAQWTAGGLDRDVACAPGIAGTRPAIVGEALVGGELRADPGRWQPAGVVVRLQWLRDDAPIPGATGPVYRPVPADAGARLSVRATAGRPGAADLVLGGAEVLVAAPIAPAAASRGALHGP